MALGPALWGTEAGIHTTRPVLGSTQLLSVLVVNPQIWLCTCSGPGDSRALLAPTSPAVRTDASFICCTLPPAPQSSWACSYLCSTEIPEGAVGSGCAQTCICTPGLA